MDLKGRTGATRVLDCLREVTGDLHQRLDKRFNVIEELADPERRPITVKRYATFYSSAHNAFSSMLASVDGLDLPQRSRAWQTLHSLGYSVHKSSGFPQPANQFEALGALYVVEGSSLGGRIILRKLASLGVDDPNLAFLDPYGSATGEMWRSLIAVLEREGARGNQCLESICHGAISGFNHAEKILCEELL